jgi:hypothetical protein
MMSALSMELRWNKEIQDFVNEMSLSDYTGNYLDEANNFLKANLPINPFDKGRFISEARRKMDEAKRQKNIHEKNKQITLERIKTEAIMSPNEFAKGYKKTKFDKETKSNHINWVINQAIENTFPISAESVDTYGITLPAGYTKQGELYVYQPAVLEMDKFHLWLQQHGEFLEENK